MSRCYWAYRASTAALAGGTVLFLTVPVIMMLPLAVSDQSYLGLPQGQLTGRWFANLDHPEWRRAIGSSLTLASLSAALATMLGALAAFRVVVHPGALSSRLFRLALPGLLIVPPIWIALGYFRLFGEGGALRLVLAHTLLALPLTFACLWYGMVRLDADLYRAAGMLGASRLSILRSVYLPACRVHISAAYLLAFLNSWDESTFALLTTGPLTQTVPKLAFETMRYDRDLTVAALNVIAGVVLSVLLAWLLHRVEL